MNATDLRVSLAALPGFDPTGLWMLAPGHTEATVRIVGICTDVPSNTRNGWTIYAAGLAQGGWMSPALDLADSATRDRVARWGAGRVGLAVGCTAPRWVHTGSGLWSLTNGRRGCRLFAPTQRPEQEARQSQDSDWATYLPSLFDLDPTDPTLLPDGSRRVDAVALARVALHLGSAP